MTSRPARRSRRTRNEPPEIVPPKSDEDDQDEEPEDDEAHKSDTSEQKATRRSKRARKPTARALKSSSAARGKRRSGQSSDDQKSKDGESSYDSDDQPQPHRRKRPHSRKKRKGDESLKDEDDDDSTGDDESEASAKPLGSAKSSSRASGQDTDEDSSDNEPLSLKLRRKRSAKQKKDFKNEEDEEQEQSRHTGGKNSSRICRDNEEDLEAPKKRTRPRKGKTKRQGDEKGESSLEEEEEDAKGEGNGSDATGPYNVKEECALPRNTTKDRKGKRRKPGENGDSTEDEAEKSESNGSNAEKANDEKDVESAGKQKGIESGRKQNPEARNLQEGENDADRDADISDAEGTQKSNEEASQASIEHSSEEASCGDDNSKSSKLQISRRAPGAIKDKGDENYKRKGQQRSANAKKSMNTESPDKDESSLEEDQGVENVDTDKTTQVKEQSEGEVLRTARTMRRGTKTTGKDETGDSSENDQEKTHTQVIENSREEACQSPTLQIEEKDEESTDKDPKMLEEEDKKRKEKASEAEASRRSRRRRRRPQKFVEEDTSDEGGDSRRADASCQDQSAKDGETEGHKRKLNIVKSGKTDKQDDELEMQSPPTKRSRSQLDENPGITGSEMDSPDAMLIDSKVELHKEPVDTTDKRPSKDIPLRAIQSGSLDDVGVEPQNGNCLESPTPDENDKTSDDSNLLRKSAGLHDSNDSPRMSLEQGDFTSNIAVDNTQAGDEVDTLTKSSTNAALSSPVTPNTGPLTRDSEPDDCSRIPKRLGESDAGSAINHAKIDEISDRSFDGQINGEKKEATIPNVRSQEKVSTKESEAPCVHPLTAEKSVNESSKKESSKTGSSRRENSEEAEVDVLPVTKRPDDPGNDVGKQDEEGSSTCNGQEVALGSEKDAIESAIAASQNVDMRVVVIDQEETTGDLQSVAEENILEKDAMESMLTTKRDKTDSTELGSRATNIEETKILKVALRPEQVTEATSRKIGVYVIMQSLQSHSERNEKSGSSTTPVASTSMAAHPQVSTSLPMITGPQRDNENATGRQDESDDDHEQFHDAHMELPAEPLSPRVRGNAEAASAYLIHHHHTKVQSNHDYFELSADKKKHASSIENPKDKSEIFSSGELNKSVAKEVSSQTVPFIAPPSRDSDAHPEVVKSHRDYESNRSGVAPARKDGDTTASAARTPEVPPELPALAKDIGPVKKKGITEGGPMQDSQIIKIPFLGFPSWSLPPFSESAYEIKFGSTIEQNTMNGGLNHKFLNGFESNKLNLAKTLLYSTGSRVHRGRGFERVFAEYWDAVSLRLSDRLSSHTAERCDRAIKQFLKSPRLRKIHNKLIMSIMKRATAQVAPLDEVWKHIPTKWHHRVGKVSMDQMPSAGADVASCLPESVELGDHRLRHQPVYMRAWDNRPDEALPLTSSRESQGEEEMKNQASSSCIPGALIVDPIVREIAQEGGVRASEDAIWLLVVAVKEHTLNVLKNAISHKEDVEKGFVPSGVLNYPTILAQNNCYDDKASTRGGSSEKPGNEIPSEVKERKVAKLTALDVYAGCERMASGSTNALGGSVSRSSLERCLHSSYDFLPEGLGTRFLAVQNFISSEIESQARTLKLQPARKKPLPVSSTSKKNPMPISATTQDSQSNESGPTSSDVKDQTTTSENPSPINEVQINQTVTGGPALNQLSDNNPEEFPGPTIPADGTRPALRGLGRGAKNLAALMKRASTGTDDLEKNAPSNETANRTPQEPVIQVEDDEPMPTEAIDKEGSGNQVGTSEAYENFEPGDSIRSESPSRSQGMAAGRRGKGFGVKNLAAMRARSTKKVSGVTDDPEAAEPKTTETSDGDGEQQSELQNNAGGSRISGGKADGSEIILIDVDRQSGGAQGARKQEASGSGEGSRNDTFTDSGHVPSGITYPGNSGQRGSDNDHSQVDLSSSQATDEAHKHPSVTNDVDNDIKSGCDPGYKDIETQDVACSVLDSSNIQGNFSAKLGADVDQRETRREAGAEVACESSVHISERQTDDVNDTKNAGDKPDR